MIAKIKPKEKQICITISLGKMGDTHEQITKAQTNFVTTLSLE